MHRRHWPNTTSAFRRPTLARAFSELACNSLVCLKHTSPVRQGHTIDKMIKRKKRKGGIFSSTTVHPDKFSCLGLLKLLFQLGIREQLFHASVSRLFLRVGVRWRARVRAGPVVLKKKGKNEKEKKRGEEKEGRNFLKICRRRAD